MSFHASQKSVLGTHLQVLIYEIYGELFSVIDVDSLRLGRLTLLRRHNPVCVCVGGGALPYRNSTYVPYPYSLVIGTKFASKNAIIAQKYSFSDYFH